VKKISKRLTYANVMSSIAVFLVIGGATAFAALGKNTVGSKQLKKNAVTTAKIKNGAVTGAKVNVSGFPKVPTAANADNAANAANATHANNADKATNALDLGGVPASGYQPRTRWAYIGASGTVLAFGGGAAPTVEHPFPGGYYIEWGTPVTGSAVISSLASSDLFSGNVATSPCGTGSLEVLCFSGSNTPSETFTYTTSKDETEADRAFYVELVG
jgi:hypothetical protein